MKFYIINMVNKKYYTLCFWSLRLLVSGNNSVSQKVKIRFTLEEATKAQRGSRWIALLIFNLGARWGGSSGPHPG
jgi:hypothetical protein